MTIRHDDESLETMVSQLIELGLERKREEARREHARAAAVRAGKKRARRAMLCAARSRAEVRTSLERERESWQRELDARSDAIRQAEVACALRLVEEQTAREARESRQVFEREQARSAERARSKRLGRGLVASLGLWVASAVALPIALRDAPATLEPVAANAAVHVEASAEALALRMELEQAGARVVELEHLVVSTGSQGEELRDLLDGARDRVAELEHKLARVGVFVPARAARPARTSMAPENGRPCDPNRGDPCCAFGVLAC